MRANRLLSFSLLLGCILGAFLGVTACADPPRPRKDRTVLAIERVRGAVVNIQSEKFAAAGALDETTPNESAQNRASGMGTGIIIDPRGYIVTNHHVIEDVNVIRAKLADGTTLSARVFARDKEHDLAILKVEPKQPLPTMPIGTSNDLMVGETVIAIGNAYGYEHTVSKGIISALGRDVSLNREVSYRSLIQTDAAINPGNSGGPLLNQDGELIGVVTAIRAGAQGIGFAIPADHMVRHVTAMFASRRRAELAPGFAGENIVEDEHHPPRRRMRVDRIDPQGPAAKAGLQTGDLVLQAGNVSVHSTIDLERALLDARAGEKLTLKVQRGDREHLIELALAGGVAGLDTSELAWRQLGVKLHPAPPEMVTRNHPTLRGGMVVLEVLPDSPADRVRIRKGDILVGLHKWETINADNVAYVLNHKELGSFYPLRYYVVRGGELSSGFLTPPD